MAPPSETLLRQPEAADAAAISALVRHGFDRFVAPDWTPEARQVFFEQSSAERLAALVPAAAFAAVAERDGRLVGFILLSAPSVLAFLFVAPDHLRQGIARRLWEAARTHVEANFPAVTTVELNASPCAVDAYEALGFYPISQPFRRGGCLATRMACWLPGRALAQA
ncbi:GNAT family N-acetyltransferase [Piscinibacter sp.]|uniref:GNAT family N-acetyltransferase n=1 Tax=Piscinibacter sp. TaxID=1903157 RepID=UPI0039E5D60E